jgi:NADH:ubiquinone oxidoreductase subunit E
VADRPITGLVSELSAKYGRSQESVLRILTDVNRAAGCVSIEAIQEIAKATGVSTAEVQSVATFYSFISLAPRGRHIVRLCNTISCSMKGSAGILAAVEKELGISAGQTTPDGRITLETTSCLGLCDKSPAMLVDETPHTGLTPAGACEILRSLGRGDA